MSELPPSDALGTDHAGHGGPALRPGLVHANRLTGRCGGPLPSRLRASAPICSTARLLDSPTRQHSRLPEDPSQYRDGAGVGGVHAVEGHAARAEGLGAGIGRVRGVVDDAEIDVMADRATEVDRLLAGVTLEAAVLVDRADVRPRFHLDDREVFAVVEVQIALVLEIGALNGDGLLIVERGAEAEERGDSPGSQSSCRTSRCCPSARQRRRWPA